MSVEQLATVKIVHGDEYAIINERDFDPEKHRLFGVKAKAPDKQISESAGEAFSDDQLRDIIESATGNRPHHKKGRAKLVEEFDALSSEADGA